MNIFKKLYYGFLGLFFDHEAILNSFEQEDIFWYHLKNITINDTVGVKQIAAQPVAIQEYPLKESSPINCQNIFLKLPPVSIKSPNDIFKKSIKWIYKNIEMLCIARNYPLIKDNSILNITKSEVKLRTKSSCLCANELIIKRNLKIFEEIIEVEPYTHSGNISKMLKLPIIKTPVARSEFSKEQMNYLREKLAQQAQVKKISVNLLHIYDKFSPGLFETIKQNHKTSEIKGYLGKENPKTTSNDIYYLILGCRKDNNNIIKVLVHPKDLENIK